MWVYNLKSKLLFCSIFIFASILSACNIGSTQSSASLIRSGTLAISGLTESIPLGGSSAATVTLMGSQGITIPVQVNIVSNDVGIMKLTPESCTLTSANNSCSVNLSGESLGTATFTISANNYESKTSPPLTVVSMLAWLQQFGSESQDFFSSDISVSPNVNIYITGAIYPTDSFLPGYFIARYTESGSQLWTLQVGAESGDTEGNGVCTDADGNVYITGDTDIGLSGQTFESGDTNYFIAKYSESGLLWWSRQVGAGLGDTIGNGISVDSNGNAYIVGYTEGTLPGQTRVGRRDYFLVKYTESGLLLWTRQVGAESGSAEGNGVSTDANSNVYITGFTNESLSGQAKVGLDDYFLAKYTESGFLLWTRVGGAESGDTQGNGVSVGPDQRVYIVGFTDVGISGQTQVGRSDYFLAQYSESGALLWARQAGTKSLFTQGTGVSSDNAGNIYITGFLSSSRYYETSKSFIAKYMDNGSLLWSEQLGTESGASAGAGVAVDYTGNAYITGTTDIGLAGESQVGFSDYFIAKYYP